MNAAAVIVPIVPTIRLKRILYATDFSEGSKMALPVVSAIARRYGAEILVAHVCPSRSYPLATPEAVFTLDRKKEREAGKELGKVVRDMEALGVPAKLVLKHGEPVMELERLACTRAVDLAVLSIHGRSGVQRVLIGSVAEAFLRDVACPVLTVGPHFDPDSRTELEIKNILFPTDLSQESRAVFPYLASLAHEYQAKITLLHVLPPETESNPDARTLAEPLRKEMKRIFGCEISPECEAEFVIESGDAAERILAAARKADLIGFGIRKAGEMTTHLRNTIAYKVLMSARCPVLTCRA